MTQNFQQGDVLDFNDLTPIIIPVKMGGKNFHLVEASTDADCKYRNKQMQSAKLDKEGRPISVDNFADADPYLLSMCLFEVVGEEDNGDPKYRKVDEKAVRRWQASVVKKLVEKLKEISGMDKDDEPEETEEYLTKQIEELTHKRAVLRGEVEEAEEDPVKND